MSSSITIALSKGRILSETIRLLKAAHIEIEDDPNKSRKLIINTSHPDINVMLVRASDVPTYVEYGAADMGVAGKDVLMEYGSAELYEPLDLKIARCRLMTAGKVGAVRSSARLKVATKFVKIAKHYFASRGIQADIIKLYGSMELAPLVGMTDLIVDIVDTGKTLRANGLEPVDLIAEISSRVVVNRASMKIKYKQIGLLLEQLVNALKVEA